MRQKAIELKKLQAMERIEAKIDFMLRSGGIDPETLEPFDSRKEPEAPVVQDEIPPASDGSESVEPASLPAAGEPDNVETPAEAPEQKAEEDKPKSRGGRNR